MPQRSIQISKSSAGGQPSGTLANRCLQRRKDFWEIVTGIFPFVLILVVAAIALAKDPPGKLELKTTAFPMGGKIPVQYTCSGDNISPALSWSQPPLGTRSFALIVEDPDAPAGTWVHWVVYNLPASSRQLPQHIPPGDEVVGGGKQGLNDFPQNGYGGPCPPPGKPHRYFFRLYALDAFLDLRSPVHRQNVDAAMQGHILAQGEWMGMFGR